MSGPTRLGAAIATLICVWSVVFWVTPSVPGPSVTFGQGPQDAIHQPVDIIDPIAPKENVVPQPVPFETNAVQQYVLPPEDETLSPPAVEPPAFLLYIIAADDDADTISTRFYGSNDNWGAIMRANPEIDFGRELSVGRVIRVPVDPGNIQGQHASSSDESSLPVTSGATEYVVRDNDNLGAISLRFYGTTTKWTVIRDANSGVINREGTNIKPGMKIIIPRP